MTYTCPVCGFNDLDEPPYSPDGHGLFEICPSCGFQFGVTDDDLGINFNEWRESWIAKGMRWTSKERAAPPKWNPKEQLLQRQMILFQKHEGPKLAGRVIYRASEYSFDFEARSESELRKRAGNQGTTSILIGTLQLEIGIENGSALFVWGLHTHTKWLRDKLPPISASFGSLKLVFDEAPSIGVSKGFKEISQLRTTYDPDSGWIRVRWDEDLLEENHVEFAGDTVAGLACEKLISLWLRPVWTV